MSAISKQINICSIEHAIQLHPAWQGYISGLTAEKLLRNQKKSYLYVLRAGESENDYYVTFTHPDGSVRHQAFTITVAPEGWYYENGTPAGPFQHTDATIDDVIYKMIYCEKEECAPLTNFVKR